jgi:multidrug efflux pump subunit AcrA (membrane-fusion protein)
MSSHPLPPASTPVEIDWHEVEDLLDELSVAARAELEPAEFYRRLLARLAPSAGATSAEIWIGPAGSLRLAQRVDRAGNQAAFGTGGISKPSAVQQEVVRARQPRVIATATDESVAGGHRVTQGHVLHPLGAASQVPGLLQLSTSGELAPAAGRSLARLLAAAAELVDDFHRQHELRRLQQQQRDAQPIEQFGLQVHRSLDLETTTLSIANEGRRVVGCDRLSVLVRKGRRYRLSAASGVDSIDRRSPSVTGLERLANACAKTGEPLWYSDGTSDLAAEIETPLHAYLEVSHARMVAIVPLASSDSASQGARLPQGILVAEQFQSATDEGLLRQRLTAVSEHAGLALANAISVTRQPLGWLTRRLSTLTSLSEPRGWLKGLLALGVVVAAIGALVLVPADFDIEARGELLPKTRREVFATDGGVIRELAVDHGQAVHAGQPLLVIRKAELDLEFRRVAGEMQTAEKKLSSIQAERLENSQAGPDARKRARQLTADEEELKEQLKSLREQHDLLRDHREELVVRSPIDGEAMTWNIKQLLEARPVERGQALLTVADPAGPWELELHLGDHRAGHVLDARDQIGRELDVSFALLADPGREYRGKLANMALASEIDDDDRPIVRLTVDFNRDEVSQLRAGATALARIHCGRRSLGYVWLHDLFEFVQSHWWW